MYLIMSTKYILLQMLAHIKHTPRVSIKSHCLCLLKVLKGRSALRKYLGTILLVSLRSTFVGKFKKHLRSSEWFLLRYCFSDFIVSLQFRDQSMLSTQSDRFSNDYQMDGNIFNAMKNSTFSSWAQDADQIKWACNH